MPPKPLPSQLRIGVDICQILRIENLVKIFDESAKLEKWASNIFNSHEWPEFCLKQEQWRKRSTGPYTNDFFSHWLAGRWAAKEAAIKAHSHRRLLRLDISILPPATGGLKVSGKTTKPRMLIDPPRRIVKMDIETAIARGLRETVLNQKDRKVLTVGTLSKADGTASEGDTMRTRPPSSRQSTLRHSIDRRHLVKEEDKQLADLSISHDGDYAIAVCMALDEGIDEHTEPCIDDGTGEAIHEPEWGDEGFGKRN